MIKLLKMKRAAVPSDSHFVNMNRRLGPARMNYHLSISLKNKYMFCEVPKSGCSSLKKMLWTNEVSDVPMPAGFLQKHWNVHAEFASHLLVKPYQLGQAGFDEMIRDPSYLKWAVVRNPFTRILSAYLDKVVRNTGHKNFLGIEDGSAISFTEFCRLLSEKILAGDGVQGIDHHFRVQYNHICADLMPYDHIGKLENLEDTLNLLRRHTGKDDLAIKRVDHHKTDAKVKIASQYTDEAADLIRTAFRLDFEKFDYSLELPTT